MIYSPPWETTSYSADHKIPRPFYGSQRFITLFTRVRHQALLSWVRRIRPTFSRNHILKFHYSSIYAQVSQAEFSLVVYRLHTCLYFTSQPWAHFHPVVSRPADILKFICASIPIYNILHPNTIFFGEISKWKWKKLHSNIPDELDLVRIGTLKLLLYMVIKQRFWKLAYRHHLYLQFLLDILFRCSK
jgi:hypothetical protein